MLRPYTVNDYSLMKSWAEGRKWPVIPAEFLPTTGIIDPEHCVGFLYKTDSKICWLEWVLGNPNSDKEERSKALDNLILALLCEAKSCGYKVVFTSVEHTGLIDRYKKNGFVVSENSMTNMIRSL